MDAALLSSLKERNRKLLEAWAEVSALAESLGEEAKNTQALIKQIEQRERQSVATATESSLRILPYFSKSIKTALLDVLRSGPSAGLTAKEIEAVLLEGGIRTRSKNTNVARTIHVTANRLISEGRIEAVHTGRAVHFKHVTTTDKHL